MNGMEKNEVAEQETRKILTETHTFLSIGATRKWKRTTKWQKRFVLFGKVRTNPSNLLTRLVPRVVSPKRVQLPTRTKGSVTVDSD